jgi:hypothetical protein
MDDPIKIKCLNIIRQAREYRWHSEKIADYLNDKGFLFNGKKWDGMKVRNFAHYHKLPKLRIHRNKRAARGIDKRPAKS